MSKYVEYQDLFAIHPACYLSSAISELGITQAELASRLDLSEKTVSELLHAKCGISDDIADRLSNMLGTGPEVWVNLQKTYDLKIIEIKRAKALNDQTAILEQLDYSYFTSNNVLLPAKTDKEKVDNLCGFLNIADLNILRNNALLGGSGANRSLSETNRLNAKIWLQTAIHKARDIEEDDALPPFDEDAFKTNAGNLRKLVLLKPRKAFPKIREILSACGVAFVVLPYLENSGIFGAVSWIGTDSKRPVLAVNNHQKKLHTLWMTFFKGIGHILAKKITRTYYFDETDVSELTADERKAGAYADNLLFGKHLYKAFLENRPFSKKDIRRFADETGVPPEIVYGKLYRDGFIPLTDVPEPEPFKTGKIGRIGVMRLLG